MIEKIENPFLQLFFCLVFSGTVFWLTDYLIMFLGFIFFPPVWIVAKTILLPLFSVLIFNFVVKAWGNNVKKIFGIAISMVVGIFLFSPLFMIIMVTFSGKEIDLMPIKELSISTWWIIFAFPMMYSTYTGGLLGLGITLVCLPVEAISFMLRRKL